MEPSATQMDKKSSDEGLPVALIELKLVQLAQLFNSMDPSPFHERDLDRDAEDFILSWAREYPKSTPFKLVIHLVNTPDVHEREVAGVSIRNYFDYRAKMLFGEFKRLMREGRVALMIGLGFLLMCQGLAMLLLEQEGSWFSVVHQGLTITGWVAMWRPMEIYLYRWWPILAERDLMRRLAQAKVEVV